MVAYLINPLAVHTQNEVNQSRPDCAAKAMTAKQRRGMAMQVLTGKESISQTAREHQVSRKFVDQQTAKAQQALDAAFIPAPDAPHDLLFCLPVTKSWIRQAPLGLGLTCRASERGIVQFFSDHIEHSISPGTVHNILTSAVPLARVQNDAVDIRNIRDAALDELFQGQRPVLAGADVESTDCFLLSPEEHRDADTWGLRLLELVERGFQPHSTIADFGTGLRAGVAEALPNVPCRGDVFHAEYDLDLVGTTDDGTSPKCHQPWMQTAAPRLSKRKRLEKELAKQQYYQKRAAQARRSHTKTRIARLKALGVDADSIKSCHPLPPK